MAIKKIISIKNAGRFKNYNAAGDVEFKKSISFMVKMDEGELRYVHSCDHYRTATLLILSAAKR